VGGERWGVIVVTRLRLRKHEDGLLVVRDVEDVLFERAARLRCPADERRLACSEGERGIGGAKRRAFRHTVSQWG
jgi:hypothetical protein